MLHDIAPHSLTYDPGHFEPQEEDRVFFIKDGQVLLKASEGPLDVPLYGQARRLLKAGKGSFVYVFSVDGAPCYLCFEEPDQTGPFLYRSLRAVRELEPSFMAFACATAFHLANWYEGNRYCGQCAARMLPKQRERALMCPACRVVKYPRISPVVIVGIRHDDALLLVKNATGEYRDYALIAGFVESGETLEAAVAREVMEEAGLKVKNLQYYKSQPWAFSQSLLTGFFADLDGTAAVTLDGRELAEARWFARTEIPADTSGRFSLTWDMIEAFRNGEM